MLAVFRALAIAGIVSFGLGGASWAEATNLKKTYPNFDVAMLMGILAEAEIPFSVTQLGSGDPIVLVQVGGGNTAFLAPTRCQAGPGKECYSLLYMAIGNKNQLPYGSYAENLVAVNFLSAWADLAEAHINPESDRPIVINVLNSDHGVAKGNVLANLGLLVMNANYIFGEMAKIKEAASMESSFGQKDSTRTNQLARHGYPEVFIHLQASHTAHLTQKPEGPVYSLVKKGDTRAILSSPAFLALMATKDFDRDFGFAIGRD